jgi:predicted metal-dependent hydrolase
MIENGQAGGAFILHYGGLAIPFHIQFRERKHLAITVHPEMILEVTAPKGTDQDKVLARVEKRARWIARQWRFFEQYRPPQPERRFVSGETHVYLGRQYRLKVQMGLPEGVKLIGQFLYVLTVDPKDGERVSNLLEEWYRTHAQRVFAHRLQGCLETVRSLRLTKTPNMVIRKMTKRWGSCTKTGNILLNLDLVKVPVHCIDYVIVHELCHLKAHNHGKEFYRLLATCMPDWEARKKRLESGTHSISAKPTNCH